MTLFILTLENVRTCHYLKIAEIAVGPQSDLQETMLRSRVKFRYGYKHDKLLEYLQDLDIGTKPELKEEIETISEFCDKNSKGFWSYSLEIDQNRKRLLYEPTKFLYDGTGNIALMIYFELPEDKNKFMSEFVLIKKLSE